MLSYKLFGAGAGSLEVSAFTDTLAYTATGTNQATAVEITTGTADFTTVASGTGGILSSKAVAGDTQVVLNSGANPLLVYPPVGAKFNALAANQAMTLPKNTSCLFACISSTKWTGVLSA